MTPDNAMTPEEAPRPVSDVLAGLVDRLESDAQDRLGRRRLVEQRWLTDIRQYEGQDNVSEIGRLNAEGRSTAVVNVTRAKCNTFESKLYDMLFPTDDRNWAINPTPVPDLVQETENLKAEVERMTHAANSAQDDGESMQFAQQADMLAQRLAEAETTQAVARQRADLMADEIDDNLVEGDYASECRSVLHDATICGTGILKGPLPQSEHVRKNWLRTASGFKMMFRPDQGDRFRFQHVSFWHLFPDMTARSFDQVESWMERHILRDRDLRHLAKTPGVDVDAVRRLLEEGPQSDQLQYILDIDMVAEEDQAGSGNKFFTMWEYRGPLEKEEMIDLFQNAIDAGEVEIDPLLRLDVVVWICQGELIKVGINHMDDNASIYSIFQIERSPARLWSVGIPYLMRDQAAILNDAWRAMVDNANYAAFPITEVNTAIVERADSSDNLVTPRSVWERKPGFGAEPGMIFHNMPVHQQHYGAIIGLVMQFLDQETSISILAQGEQGQTTRTAGGMALLMNSTNIVFRRVVKNYDDGITGPCLRRAYDFLMQFSPKEEIKGDYAVQPRGSSVLLVREVQAQNLLLLATQISLHPLLGRNFKMRELAKALCSSMLLPSDTLLKTMQEVADEEIAEREAAESAPPDPAMVKLQLDHELGMAEMETKRLLAEMKAEGEAARAQVQERAAMEQILGRIQAVREQNASRERIMAAEIGVEARRPPGARGSGGYV